MRVKIVDEYNRIPARAQSALLTVMDDNYAAVLNHMLRAEDNCANRSSRAMQCKPCANTSAK